MNQTETGPSHLAVKQDSADITDDVRRRTLLGNRTLQEAILRNGYFSIIATDQQGLIQFFSAGAERMLGFTAAEVVNKLNPSDLHDLDEVMARAEALSIELASPIKPGFEALAGKASRGMEDVYELTYLCKDGRRAPALVSITALRGDHDEIIGYLLISSNDAVRKRVVAGLASAKAAAEQASVAKSEFLLQVSHELRTPLNVILGFAHLMETGFPPPAPSQQQNLEQILIAAQHLLDLSNQVVDLALIESGKVTLTIEPVSLAEVMDECRALVAPQAKKRYVNAAFPRFELPCYVSADRTRLKQILINLLMNAINYNKPGAGVAVECTPGSADSTRLSIRDTGMGLTPEQLARLFQPFNRRSEEAGAEMESGIGLAVAQQLAELMGGTIGVESGPGRGTAFWIDLKTTTAPLSPPAARGAAPMRTPLPENAAPRTILYVEDNAANLALVRQLIARRTDLRLISAVNGALGIESAGANQPDLILMDLNMPGMSGIEAMEILRADPATAHIPIIALSANAMPRDIEKGLEAGFFDYVTKPIMVGTFMNTLDAALNFSQRARCRTIYNPA